jgi:hypothetical protein
MVLDNHGGFYDFDNYGAQSCYSSPSIAMMNTLGPGFRMAVSYLRSRNPSSQAWNPASVVLMTNVNANPMETYGTETLVSQTINGRWDSGAQYTNWYGPSTSIAVMDPLYWILWSSWQNGQFGLNQVYGAYGYPEP